METFNEFFEESCKINEIYENFGNFGKEIYKDLIQEGLITSYPFSKIKKFVQYDLSLKNGYFNVDEVDNNNQVIGGILSVVTSDKLESAKIELEKALTPYGYFLGKVRIQDAKTLDVMIEPKFPSLLDRSTLYQNYYHLTHRKYLDKIRKIGLTPRSSQTNFSHPGGRIYLLNSPTWETSLIYQFKFMVSAAKNAHSIDVDTDRYYRSQSRGYDWASKKVVVLHVKLPPDVKLYKDPMFPKERNSEITPLFITQNIPPSNITLIE